jgi:hypothetical protein
MAVTITHTIPAAGQPGSGQPFNPDEWAPAIETAARDFRVMANLVRVFTFKGPADTLQIPKLGTISAAAFSQANEEGTTAINYPLPTNNTVTITPGMSYNATRVAQRELDHSIYDLESALQDELGEGLAQFEDAQLAAFADDAGFTVADLGGDTQNYTEALLLSQLQTLVTFGKSKVRLGPRGNVSLVFHSLQLNDLLAISSISSWSVTGRENGPALTGQLTNHWGVGFYMSDNVKDTGSVKVNPMFSQEAIAFARLYMPKFRQQWDSDNIAWKLVAWQEYGMAVLNATALVNVDTD